MFSIASIATMSACIFLFGLFFSLLINVQYIVKGAEEGVAITVLFNEDADQAAINAIGEEILGCDGVTSVDYISAEQAWDEFSKDYFGGEEEAEKWSEGFINDNPLANSSSYSVYVDKIENQDAVVSYIQGLEGVREVNQLKSATDTLSTFNSLLTTIAVTIILILLCVAVAVFISMKFAVATAHDFVRPLEKVQEGTAKLSKGELEDTVIVAVTDHYTYGYKDTENLMMLSGTDIPLLLEKTPCFIWSADLEPMEVDKVLNTSDFLPTLLNLLGVDSPYRYIGRDAFDDSYPGFVPFSDGSWISGNTAYLSGSKNLLAIDGSQPTLSTDAQKELSKTVQEFIRINNLILETDYYTP